MKRKLVTRKPGRPAAIVTEQRRKKAIEMTRKGHSQNQIAEALGVSQVAVCKTLKELRLRMKSATDHDFEVYRQGQLAVLEFIEESLLESKISTDVAREWRQLRGDISKLLGLDAPQRHVNVQVDGSGLYHDFLKATAHLNDAQIGDVLTYARSLKSIPTLTAEPPEINELED
jgi:predicted transcriptional regulator